MEASDRERYRRWLGFALDGALRHRLCEPADVLTHATPEVLVGQLPRELTTAVLGAETLGVTELKPKSGFYDYDAKYTDGMTEHVYPAEIPDEIAAACESIALEAHRLLGCKGVSRADFRWDDSQGVDGLFLLEINTQPGMTPLSLVPEQARHNGISYAELCQRIVDEAIGVNASREGLAA